MDQHLDLHILGSILAILLRILLVLKSNQYIEHALLQLHHVIELLWSLHH